ncbi:helix-turn-helix domain-containing protein [Streptomyces sp. YIM S03343]
MINDHGWRGGDQCACSDHSKPADHRAGARGDLSTRCGLVFVDRLLSALVHLRHGATNDVLACWFGVDRSPIIRAIDDVRPPLAECGCTIAPGLRLCTLAEVVDRLGATGQTGIMTAMRSACAGRRPRTQGPGEVRLWEEQAKGREAMVVTDTDGRLLFCSPAEPASVADITHARQPGLVKLLVDGPAVEILAHAGYQGMGAQTGGRVVRRCTASSRRDRLSGTRTCTNDDGRVARGNRTPGLPQNRA